MGLPRLVITGGDVTMFREWLTFYRVTFHLSTLKAVKAALIATSYKWRCN